MFCFGVVDDRAVNRFCLLCVVFFFCLILVFLVIFSRFVYLILFQLTVHTATESVSTFLPLHHVPHTHTREGPLLVGVEVVEVGGTTSWLFH